tara:strand:- start:7222 stop:7983 length:762 start_codon:yes stop_codon:yes gene_type:complete
MMDLKNLQAGDEHYKAFVGPPLKYDLLGALQFTLITAAGLRADHTLCDIGCGSLRAGKLLIPYLNSGNYYGIEPNQWLIDEAISQEIGQDLVDLKNPNFLNGANFEISKFQEKFDFILAQSIFSHASGSQIRACLKEVRQSLNPKGIFIATFIWGKEDYEGEEWVYPGCVSYRPNTVKDWAWRDYGLKMKVCDWPHPNGQNWAIFHLPGQEHHIDQIARFNMDAYKADVVAIPDQQRSGVLNMVKAKLKSLIE